MQEKHAEVEVLNLDYKVKELLEIMKSVPSIQEFIKDMSYMKKLDINLIYDQYKDVFMHEQSFVTDFGENPTFQN